MDEFPGIMPALPEIFLACSAMALLLFGVLRGDGSARLVSSLSVACMLVTAGLVVRHGGARDIAFGGMFVVDGFAIFAKALMLLGASAVLLVSHGYGVREKIARFEFPVLIVLSVVGMMMMISANDLMALYMGLETQSLALYVLACFRRNSVASSEAGLKYFVLGALASGLLLFGASFVYGFTGTTNFNQIAASLLHVPNAQFGIVVGMVFMAAGLSFKVAAVPFHMWAPDVYEGAPTSVTAFFAVAPKVAAVALLMRLLVVPFGGMTAQWCQIIVFMALASMLIGSFGAIQQTNIKRLMAYSSIGHIGFLMVGLAAGSEAGVSAVLVYLAIYLVMSVGTFAVILSMRHRGRMVEDIASLAGLSKTHPLMALVMAVFMFSMAGIPPLAGFFGKMYVFLAAVEAKLYVLAVIGVLASVVSAYYYLRIIKIMYFDDVADLRIDPQDDRSIAVVLVVCGVFIALFFLFPAVVVNAAAVAASSLFAG